MLSVLKIAVNNIERLTTLMVLVSRMICSGNTHLEIEVPELRVGGRCFGTLA